MNYFQALSLIMGTGMLVGGLWVVFRPGAWQKLVFRVMSEKRPDWVLGVNAAWTLLVLFTWGMFFGEMALASFVVTFVMSLTLLKVLGSVFFWNQYREAALTLFREPLAMRTVMVSTAAIGFALLSLGLMV
jgi:hypothetical protein